MTLSDIELELDTDTIHCTAEEVATVLAGVLREMRAAAPFVTADERETLRLIMSHPSGTLTVADVFPDFDRHASSEALTALRRLRTAQFIRPASIDRWEAGERIEIKPFARLAWDKLGEAAIFGAAPEEDVPVLSDEEHEEKGAVVPAKEPPAESEDIDLSLPDVNESDSEETVRMENKRANVWDEADVLEFLNDDSPSTLKGEAR